MMASPDNLPFPLITISGGPRERGIAYGEGAHEQIVRSLTFYAEVVTPGLNLRWGDICDQLSGRLPEWRAQYPDLVDEVEGIAEGSGQEVAEILALNSRGSFVAVASSGPDRASPDECTSWVVLPESSRDGHMLTGQNWDYLSGIRDTIVLVHIRPDRGPRQLMIVEAGQLGRHGANSAGIALHANGLSGRLRDPAAIPSPFWRRLILRSSNITEAVDAATRPTRAGSTNVLISHRDGFAIDLETQPHTARWLYPDEGWLVHTNHYLAGIPPQIASDYRPSASSLVRYGRARRLLASAAERGIGTDDLVALARDHLGDGRGLCAHPQEGAPSHDRWQTVATVITDLTDGVMSVSAGPPCTGSFAHILIETGEAMTGQLATAAGT